MLAHVKLDFSARTAFVLISTNANQIDTTVMPMLPVKTLLVVSNAHAKMVSLVKVT